MENLFFFVNIELPYDTEVPLLSLYSKELKASSQRSYIHIQLNLSIIYK